jgi:hypothetical protein
VSVVGLPGIGKTEIGKEIARQALARGDVDRVLYLEAHRGLDGEALRVKLGGFLGLYEPPKSDEALAARWSVTRAACCSCSTTLKT